jgi:hypothetical protein
MISRRKLVTLAAAGLLTVGTVLGGLPALSQTALAAEATPSTTARDTVEDKTVANVDSYLATALGISPETLAAARETARLDGIQQALDKGLITQAQADTLKSNQRMGGRGGLGFFVKDADIDEDALLAKALGITVEKLEQARATAENARIDQAVADGKMTQEQADLMKAKQKLNQYLTDKNVYSTAVAQAVKDGVITQAQADAILAQNNGRGGFGKVAPGGPGALGGRGGMRGGR